MTARSWRFKSSLAHQKLFLNLSQKLDNRRQRIGLLSGTFDPIHCGHTALAEAAIRDLKLDEVWFLVEAYPRGKDNYESFENRAEMVRRAAQDNPSFRVDAAPMQTTPNRHSIETGRILLKQFPKHKFFIVMGEDVYRGINAWEQIEEIEKIFEFGVAARGERSPDGNFHPIGLGPVPYSSSAIRAQLSAGRVPEGLSGRVYEYIKKQKLYTGGKA